MDARLLHLAVLGQSGVPFSHVSQGSKQEPLIQVRRQLLYRSTTEPLGNTLR